MTPASAMHACGEVLQAQTGTLETLAGDHLDPILAGMEDAARGCLHETGAAFDRAVEIMGDLAKNLDARLEEFRGRVNAAMGCLAKPLLGVPAAGQQRERQVVRAKDAGTLEDILIHEDGTATLAPAFPDDMTAFTGRTPEETPTVRIEPTEAAKQWAKDNGSSWVPEVAPHEAPVRIEPAIAALNRPECSIDAPTAADKLTEILTPEQVDALPEADLDERIRREVAEACPGFPMCPGFPHEVATAACSPVAPPSPLCGCGEWNCPECGKRPKPAKPRGKGKPHNARS